MVKVGGKPVLEHLIDHLAKFEIKQIIVNLHWKPQPLIDYFGDKLLYFYEPKLLGEKKTEDRLRDWLGFEYLVMNGDTLTDIDINQMRMFSRGNTSYDDEVYTGIKYVLGGDSAWRRDYKCYWQYMGTVSGLQKARKRYGG